MNIISKEQLKNKIDRGEAFKLIMTMNDWAYEQLHIPGSLHFENMGEAIKLLSRSDEVVVYASVKECHYSVDAYLALKARGFENIYYYPGGLEEWMNARYPLEGNMVH